MKATVDGTAYTLVESGEDRWEVFEETPDRRDPIGEVWKGTRTYSPPAAGFGGRIVRFHKKVPCWRSSAWALSRSFETRKEAIRSLAREQTKEETESGN